MGPQGGVLLSGRGQFSWAGDGCAPPTAVCFISRRHVTFYDDYLRPHLLSGALICATAMVSGVALPSQKVPVEVLELE
ncbi:hypothetical protein CEXT_341131 [Caerostris extrusa]|uniref:Uncharacterized protein n=1 Tax=Caerostris extrusa TaxID=172846 RepID=A0AAV4Q943_CAEEX|nr:hypothetical protein CEXT_341131 [Caerostris extrusa]